MTKEDYERESLMIQTQTAFTYLFDRQTTSSDRAIELFQAVLQAK